MSEGLVRLRNHAALWYYRVRRARRTIGMFAVFAVITIVSLRLLPEGYWHVFFGGLTMGLGMGLAASEVLWT